MVPDIYIEYYYGKYATVDLHNLTKEEAKVDLIYAIETQDYDIKCLVVIHGYHGGTVIKNLVRKEFSHKLIEKKVPFDAGRTIYVLKR